MSLINQMLKDLQEQKNGEEKERGRLQPKRMQRVPYLPLPVVLGGGAVLLLSLVWWLSGVLADVMFEYDPVQQEAASLQVAQKTSPEVAPRVVVTVQPDAEPLTEEERTAEAPQETIDSKKAETVEKTLKPVATASEVVATPPEKETRNVVAVKKRVSPPAPVVTEKSARTVKAARSVNKVLAQAKARKVTQKPKRIHADQLPGALKTPVSRVPEVNPLEQRRSRTPANTPYGRAEEAYLDAKWALARERKNLAVLSLQESLQLYPGHLNAREQLAELMTKSGKTGEAMFLLAEGLEIAPDYMTFKKSYTSMLSDQGDYDAAIKVMLNGGLPPVDKDPAAHVLLASLYQQLGESFLAAQTYRNLLVEWPQTGAFWVALGSSLEKQQLAADAMECYKKALETNNLRQDLSLFAKKRLSQL